MSTLKNLISYFIKIQLVLIIAFIVYNLIDILELTKNVKLKNDENCHVIKGAIGIEDFFQYDDNHLIGISNDNLNMWELESSLLTIDNGSIIVFDKKNEKLKKYNIINFPENIAFHPHGIYPYKNAFIYIINHAYNRGGERIEVVKIQKENDTDFLFIYEKSMILPTELNGITNDLIVVGPHDDIYITTYLPYPDEETGRSKGIIQKIKTSLPVLFRLKMTYIYYCHSSHLRNTNIPPTFKCSKVKTEESRSLMNNGIAFDEDNDIIYVSDLLDKKIKIFKRDQINKKILKYENEIKIGYACDNILLYKDKKGDTILTIGVLGKVINHMYIIESSKKLGRMTDEKFSFGSVKVTIKKDTNFENKEDFDKNIKVEKLVMQDKYFKGISSALQIDKYSYMTSWGDDGILICKLR